jgi:hypothetical protein
MCCKTIDCDLCYKKKTNKFLSQIMKSEIVNGYYEKKNIFDFYYSISENFSKR